MKLYSTENSEEPVFFNLPFRPAPGSETFSWLWPTGLGVTVFDMGELADFCGNPFRGHCNREFSGFHFGLS